MGIVYASQYTQVVVQGDVKRTFDVVVTKDADGYFVASVPALQGCHTQGKTRAELRRNVKDVILLCLKDAPVDPIARFVGIEQVSVEA